MVVLHAETFVKPLDLLRLHSSWVVYFDEVARARSIRAAARRLNVAPSAISRQIRDLEATLGETLLERVPRGLRLTAAGEYVAEHARQVLHDLERMRGAIEDLRGLRRGSVAIATVEGAAVDLLPRVVTALRSSHPHLSFDCRVAGSDDAMKLLQAGEADIAVTFHPEPAARIRHLIAVPLPMGAIVAPEHALAARSRIRLQDLVDMPLVLPDASVHTRAVLDRLLHKSSLDLRPFATSTSLEFMRAIARLGAGIAFQTPVGLERELAEGSLRFVPLVEPGLEPPKLTVSVSTARPPGFAAATAAEAICAAVGRLLDV
jgi:DNA-binding transcriptional LysR family regulator